MSCLLLAIPSILCAVLSFGVSYAYARAEFTHQSNGDHYVFAVVPGILALLPVIGVASLIMCFVMSDFAKHGVRFK